MIIAFVIASVVGVAAGVSCDELLRGRDSRSSWVTIAGVVGAMGGFAIRRIAGGDDLLLEMLTSLVGALLLAFATRARISADLARGQRWSSGVPVDGIRRMTGTAQSSTTEARVTAAGVLAEVALVEHPLEST